MSCTYYGQLSDHNTCAHLTNVIGCDCRGCDVNGETCAVTIDCCPESLSGGLYDCTRYNVGECQETELCVPGPGTYTHPKTGVIMFEDGLGPQCASQICNDECTKEGFRNKDHEDKRKNGVCNDGRGDPIMGPDYDVCDLGTDCE